MGKWLQFAHSNLVLYDNRKYYSQMKNRTLSAKQTQLIFFSRQLKTFWQENRIQWKQIKKIELRNKVNGGNSTPANDHNVKMFHVRDEQKSRKTKWEKKERENWTQKKHKRTLK